MRVLSVDLGTSNTVAVLSAHGRPPRVIEVDGSATMPSAVFAAEDGGLVVGRDAERRARLDPSRFEPNPKRRIDDGTLLLGDTVVPVSEALAAVLKRVADETSRQLGGGAPDEVRLTHPAQWGPVRRNVLLTAARLAGLGSALVLVPEPVAAAAHFASLGHALRPGQALAVYDLGAGTFDVAVVAATQAGFAVLAEDGLHDLGGMDVDQTLLEHVGRQVSHRDPRGWQHLLRPESTADRRARRALQEDVKAAKEALSRHPQTEVPMPEPFDDVLVTRAELEALIRPSLLRSVELLSSTIRATGLGPDRLGGVYLVGGSSRIPLVATLIAEQLRIVPTSLDQPETAVALGAHQVTQEGISLRTAGVAPGSAQPGSGPFPTQQPPHAPQLPNPGPQTAAQPLPTGGFPATPQGFPQQANFPTPPRQNDFPTPPRPGGKRPGVLVGVAAAVVLALAVVGGIFLFTSGDDLPTAESCRTAGARDAQGFTACLRQLAGAVPDGNRCQAADADAAADVTCALPDSYTVSYAQVGSPDEVQGVLRAELGEMTEGEHVLADWHGNGLDGKYRAGVSGGTGVLVFTVEGRPLVGWLSRSGGDESAELTPDALADYFAQRVQPGT
ncbi:molecular chaperone protein [Actinokineospora spheciospongiae]|uniref:Molecular chaperone protein n=1 Tax=Actinokineospora spheciospongiae TaxID=909613 RepID=W7IP16_9PSEU|nr:Hsp70 family protein [Actinokineospora spheciospongiae]EWC58301.1 molecular chaperone protein [Actinokineospora spheciospongiae]